MLRFVRQGQIPFVPLFIFIEEIVMKISTTKKLICEDKFLNLCHTLKLACVCVFVCVCVCVRMYVYVCTL